MSPQWQCGPVILPGSGSPQDLIFNENNQNLDH
jgi:hypothetical protein